MTKFSAQTEGYEFKRLSDNLLEGIYCPEAAYQNQEIREEK